MAIRHVKSLLCLCFCIKFSGFIQAANSFPSFNDVNWTVASSEDASTASLAAPIGCTCLQKKSSKGSCLYFKCNCACDLNAGICDPLCCCDMECPKEQIEITKSRGLCINEKEPEIALEYCSTNAAQDQSSTSNPLLSDSVLCIAVDNNEVVGEFIAASAEEEMTVTKAFMKNPKLFSFISPDSSVQETLNPPSTTLGSEYRPGDFIKVFPANSKAYTFAPYLLTFGTGMDSNECFSMNPLRFALENGQSSCIHTIKSLVKECGTDESPFNVQAFIQNIVVARWPNVSSSSINDKSQVVSVDISEVLEYDPAQDTTTLLSTPYPSYFPKTNVFTDPITNKKYCQGTLLELEYLLTHDGLGHLTAVSAKVTIGTVPLDDMLDVSQSFKVHFVVESEPAERSYEKGNLMSFPRSGNPGYLPHLPVRVGKIISQSTDDDGGGGGGANQMEAISELSSGFFLGSPLGTCNKKVTFSNGVVVRFDEDIRTTCSMIFTQKEFETFCERTSESFPSALDLISDITHVGIFGNADPLMVSDWLKIEYEPIRINSAIFDTTTSTCKDLITSLNVEFLVASVGPVNDPQFKIVAARAYHGKETIQFLPSSPLTSSFTKRTFLFSTNVNFVHIQATSIQDYILPTPPIWFSIPNDVFYPFLLNHGEKTTLSWAVGFIWTLCFFFFLFLPHELN